MENYIYGVITGLVASLIGFVIHKITKDTNGIQDQNDWEA
jgi:hypothetical protein